MVTESPTPEGPARPENPSAGGSPGPAGSPPAESGPAAPVVEADVRGEIAAHKLDRLRLGIELTGIAGRRRRTGSRRRRLGRRKREWAVPAADPLHCSGAALEPSGLSHFPR